MCSKSEGRHSEIQKDLNDLGCATQIFPQKYQPSSESVTDISGSLSHNSFPKQQFSSAILFIMQQLGAIAGKEKKGSKCSCSPFPGKSPMFIKVFYFKYDALR